MKECEGQFPHTHSPDGANRIPENTQDNLEVNDVQKDVRGKIHSSMENQEKEYEIKNLLRDIFKRFQKVVQDELDSIARIKKGYDRAFNIAGNMWNFAIQDYLKKSNNPEFRARYMLFRKQLKETDSAPQEDLQRSSEIAERENLFQMLLLGTQNRINMLNSQAAIQDLLSAFSGILLLEHYPEFDDYKEFRMGPLARFFQENRKTIDTVCSYFESINQS